MKWFVVSTIFEAKRDISVLLCCLLVAMGFLALISLPQDGAPHCRHREKANGHRGGVPSERLCLETGHLILRLQLMARHQVTSLPLTKMQRHSRIHTSAGWHPKLWFALLTWTRVKQTRSGRTSEPGSGMFWTFVALIGILSGQFTRRDRQRSFLGCFLTPKTFIFSIWTCFWFIIFLVKQNQTHVFQAFLGPAWRHPWCWAAENVWSTVRSVRPSSSVGQFGPGISSKSTRNQRKNGSAPSFWSFWKMEDPTYLYNSIHIYTSSLYISGIQKNLPLRTGSSNGAVLVAVVGTETAMAGVSASRRRFAWHLNG